MGNRQWLLKSIYITFLFVFFSCKKIIEDKTKNEVQTIKDSFPIKEKKVFSNYVVMPSYINAPTQKMLQYLKEGKQGIFGDYRLKAIVMTDYAIFIKSEAFGESDSGNDEFEYQIVSFVKDNKEWKIHEQKQIVSMKEYYKCCLPRIEIMDVDGDTVNDILVLMSIGGRDTRQYNLFLNKINEKILIEVKGFMRVTTPVYNRKKNLIVSTERYSRGETIEQFRIIKDSLVCIDCRENWK